MSLRTKGERETEKKRKLLDIQLGKHHRPLDTRFIRSELVTQTVEA